MKIRQANQSDIVKVSRLWLKMVRELAPELNPNILWWREHARSYMQMKNYFMHVIDFGGQILGFIDYFLFPEPATSKVHCVGQHFYVLPEYRGNGVSGKLWKKALKSSMVSGAQTHELFCFEKEQDFWEKHGFKVKRMLMRKG